MQTNRVEESPYIRNGQVAVGRLARDVAAKLPVKNFRDYTQFQGVVQKILKQIWPEWPQPVALLRCLLKAVLKDNEIIFENGSVSGRTFVQRTKP